MRNYSGHGSTDARLKISLRLESPKLEAACRRCQRSARYEIPLTAQPPSSALHVRRVGLCLLRSPSAMGPCHLPHATALRPDRRSSGYFFHLPRNPSKTGLYLQTMETRRSHLGRPLKLEARVPGPTARFDKESPGKVKVEFEK